MHIVRIELENIKSHASSAYDFELGTTAITGENGAGKTTIIEAIAWVLFDLLDYKKEDFLRRGEKKGVVRVTFQSGLDDRLYVVYRDTGTGYYVTDPRLQKKIADKREEVLRFLWQHLGVEPGTDLRSLFKQAIGVPQGTFTSIFLEGAAERKTAFDRLLKVEEYRQAAEKLRETARYVDNSIAEIRERIARAEGELTRADQVETELADLNKTAAQLKDEVAALGQTIAERTEAVAALDVRERTIAELRSDIQRLDASLKMSLGERDQLLANIASATSAAEAVARSKVGYEKHLDALRTISELERERTERDRIQQELVSVEQALTSVTAERKRLNADLGTIANAHQEIGSLKPLAAEQVELEAALNEIREALAAARASTAQITRLDDRLTALRTSFAETKRRLDEAMEKSLLAAQLNDLEKRDLEIVSHLATLQAGLERDEKFQQEIKGGLCPILSQKCLNLKEGETLENFISSQFTDLRAHIRELEAEKTAVRSSLAGARAAATIQGSISSLEERLAELTEEGQRLRSEKAELEKRSSESAAIEDRLKEIDQRLRSLGDPRSRISIREAEITREYAIREALTGVESNLERLNSERDVLIERKEEYRQLDARWEAVTAERERTAEDYRAYISNEKQASTLDDLKLRLSAIEPEIEDLRTRAETAHASLADLEKGYDAAAHAAQRSELRDSENAFHRNSANLESTLERSSRLSSELEALAQLRRSLRDEFRERERLETVAEATQFIRDTLKEAAPRVARNYVYHVSLEANQLFRDITGNPERTLRWAEDYSVMLEEDGYERPFIGLSGGEQMSAALSIRLALLKQMTDIRIAFFDEPTTNMDVERRENLAMQIRNISHFDQLFVISHDDTFDSYVDHVIVVGPTDHARS